MPSLKQCLAYFVKHTNAEFYFSYNPFQSSSVGISCAVLSASATSMHPLPYIYKVIRLTYHSLLMPVKHCRRDSLASRSSMMSRESTLVKILIGRP